MLYFLKTKFGGKKAVKLVNEVNIVRISASTSVLCKKILAVMLLLVKCYDKKQRYRCLLSGHLPIGQALGA